MVNLEELMGENRRFYEPPRMTIKRIDFADVIVTSGGATEAGNGANQVDDAGNTGGTGAGEGDPFVIGG